MAVGPVLRSAKPRPRLLPLRQLEGSRGGCYPPLRGGDLAYGETKGKDGGGRYSPVLIKTNTPFLRESTAPNPLLRPRWKRDRG